MSVDLLDGSIYYLEDSSKKKNPLKCFHGQRARKGVLGQTVYMGKRKKSLTKFKTHKFSRFSKSAPFCYAHLIASTVLFGRHVGNINGNVKAIV